MSTQIIPFQFDAVTLRVQLDDAGQPWFNANDVCEALQLGNARQALESHVDSDDVQKMDTIDSLGRTQRANHVNESGIYALILGSTKPEAKRFKRWVTSEVLPSIRKTGSYSVEAPKTSAEALLPIVQQLIDQERALAAAHQAVARVEQRLDQIETASEQYTIIGYYSAMGYPRQSLSLAEASVKGRKAAQYCADHNIEMGEVPDPRFGRVKTYPKCWNPRLSC